MLEKIKAGAELDAKSLQDSGVVGKGKSGIRVLGRGKNQRSCKLKCGRSLEDSNHSHRKSGWQGHCWINRLRVGSMASGAEQFASSFNFGAISKAAELKRIWFTLGALIVYRLGTYIPIPGIDPAILEEIFEQNAGGILGMFDMFAGGALGRMTIFALNIMPYISAAIIHAANDGSIAESRKPKKEGEAGRKKINQYTRYLTVLLAAVQAYGISVGLENMASGGNSAVTNCALF